MNSPSCDGFPQKDLHVAVIMDGNRRWAKKEQVHLENGHGQGIETLKTVVRSCPDLSIKYLTVYAFSCENWKRNPQEVKNLMDLFRHYLQEDIQELQENNVRLSIIGQREELDKDLCDLIVAGEEKTKNNTGLFLQIALNYGGRQELIWAIKNLGKDIQNEKISPEDIGEDLLSQYLWTNGIPDPHLLIRTGGDYRLSNYLLWQMSYSEFFFLEKYWPDFNSEDLKKTIDSFQERQRRFGQ